MQLKQFKKWIKMCFESGKAKLCHKSDKTLKKHDRPVVSPADFDNRVDFFKRNRCAFTLSSAVLVVLISSVFTLGTGTLTSDQFKIFQTSKANVAEVRSPKQVMLASNFEDVSLTKKTPLIQEGLEKSTVQIEEIVENSVSYDSPALEGYTVKINKVEYGFFKTESEAQSVIDTLMSTYATDKDIVEAYFKETVEVASTRKEAGLFKEFSLPERSVDYIKRGTNKKKIHVVNSGENFWTISQKYLIAVEDLEKANPNITPEKLQVGTEINLIVPTSLLTVRTVEKTVYQEPIPHDTAYQDDSSKFKGDSFVIASGSNGEREVVAKVIRENGVEIKREIISEKVILEPTTKVVAKGTKERPPSIGSGVLAKPISRGTITSPFGTRWGRRHTGIDVGLPTGSSIKAADGGTVIYSGYDSGYGYAIRISHGDGMVTLYAHNSKLLVKKGDKVYKDQKIALSGNSGRSTGPHLHFEVRVDGVPKNPLNYIKM